MLLVGKYTEVHISLGIAGLVDGPTKRQSGEFHRRIREAMMQYSIGVVTHPADNQVNFRVLVLNVENILADAIVTSVRGIGPQRGVFGLTPSDRKFERFPAVRCAPFHGLLSSGWIDSLRSGPAE